MVLLEKLLSGLSVTVEDFAICRVAEGGALDLPALAQPSVHYSLVGNGVMRLADGPPVRLKRHSFVILPAGRAVRLEEGEPAVTASHGRCEPVAGALKRFAHGQGAGLIMACGRMTATYRDSLGLFDQLSKPLVDDFACEDGICRPFDLLLHELAAPRPGTQAMATALMQQCLVLVLRRLCMTGAGSLPWLAALEDPRLARALDAMLTRPERDVSVEDLAALAGMSRSAFAARFAAAFERTPMDMLKEIRLRRAARLLRSTDLPVKSVAGQVGYASRSYFSRAFKAHFGADPAAYRAEPLTAGPGTMP